MQENLEWRVRHKETGATGVACHAPEWGKGMLKINYDAQGLEGYAPIEDFEFLDEDGYCHPEAGDN